MTESAWPDWFDGLGMALRGARHAPTPSPLLACAIGPDPTEVAEPVAEMAQTWVKEEDDD